MTTFDTIAAERLALVERLDGLPDDEWSTPSLCDGWTVKHVLAHLVTPFAVSMPRIVAYAVRGRSFSTAMDRAAHELADVHSPTELLDILAAHADSTFTPPGFPPAAPLTDIACHSADIRWPLGDALDDWGSDPERLLPSLDFLATKHPSAFVPKGRLVGLHLVATDQDWSHGEGLRVSGTSLALAMAMIGREPALGQLDGHGVEVLASRG